jgi:hypothetical protein
MTAKVEKALRRLIGILPLKERQEICGAEIRGLHKRILRSVVKKGRILTRDEKTECRVRLGEWHGQW